MLAATAASSERLGWIDEFTVMDAVRSYFTDAASNEDVHTVLLDNFPGSSSQVDQLLAAIREVAPTCHVEAIELLTDAKTLKQRSRNRKVCHRCERDPISDPRVPAISSDDDSWKCARCRGLLHPRRGDSPHLFKARMHRYHQTAAGIRAGFIDAGIAVTHLDTTNTVDGAAELLAPLLISRSPVS
ncbi:hypothetical protein [Nocardia brasiliensis]|uniref:hypothetical protein n=1 Tax=Nocardia brasiliensis TaxID=37326 RepID=UPI0024575951|nr:hypothetical protein [Nocardia brasiliensis]